MRSRSTAIKVAVTTAMEIPVMQPNIELAPIRTVHQRYRQLLRAGFAPHESAALIALADGIAHHAEGEPPATTWRWQEISRIEFIGYLTSHGRVGGPDDGHR
jgi:cytochrome P450